MRDGRSDGASVRCGIGSWRVYRPLTFARGMRQKGRKGRCLGRPAVIGGEMWRNGGRGAVFRWHGERGPDKGWNDSDREPVTVAARTVRSH